MVTCARTKRREAAAARRETRVKGDPGARKARDKRIAAHIQSVLKQRAAQERKDARQASRDESSHLEEWYQVSSLWLGIDGRAECDAAVASAARDDAEDAAREWDERQPRHMAVHVDAAPPKRRHDPDAPPVPHPQYEPWPVPRRSRGGTFARCRLHLRFVRRDGGIITTYDTGRRIGPAKPGR